jgi:hypothetical protein
MSGSVLPVSTSITVTCAMTSVDGETLVPTPCARAAAPRANAAQNHNAPNKHRPTFDLAAIDRGANLRM